MQGNKPTLWSPLLGKVNEVGSVELDYKIILIAFSNLKVHNIRNQLLENLAITEDFLSLVFIF